MWRVFLGMTATFSLTVDVVEFATVFFIGPMVAGAATIFHSRSKGFVSHGRQPEAVHHS
ncbi:hypothetical protein CFELI_04420 [Corynebacterium felinum]|uniref:ABC-type branched-subunit amino acid transport system ATPase component n=1 Tax=Corynebacterium felinum TaxID=131318 RepID=A0ABU2B960_9CORY|nr:ABC-type branched-subunit amino acid transport system ATPase component [Corynebacterium felinum]WJY94514.1 hypothetical protein CFELI_04420 [Corynebacterium felinum]